MSKKLFVILGVLVLGTLLLTACAGPEGPQGPAGPQGEPGQMPSATDLSCTECHNDTAIISGKKAS